MKSLPIFLLLIFHSCLSQSNEKNPSSPETVRIHELNFDLKPIVGWKTEKLNDNYYIFTLEDDDNKGSWQISLYAEEENPNTSSSRSFFKHSQSTTEGELSDDIIRHDEPITILERDAYLFQEIHHGSGTTIEYYVNINAYNYSLSYAYTLPYSRQGNTTLSVERQLQKKLLEFNLILDRMWLNNQTNETSSIYNDHETLIKSDYHTFKQTSECDFIKEMGYGTREESFEVCTWNDTQLFDILEMDSSEYTVTTKQYLVKNNQLIYILWKVVKRDQLNQANSHELFFKDNELVSAVSFGENGYEREANLLMFSMAKKAYAHDKKTIEAYKNKK